MDQPKNSGEPLHKLQVFRKIKHQKINQNFAYNKKFTKEVMPKDVVVPRCLRQKFSAATDIHDTEKWLKDQYAQCKF